MDTSGSGTLEPEKLRPLIRSAAEITEEDLDKAVGVLGANADDVVSFDQFKEWWDSTWSDNEQELMIQKILMCDLKGVLQAMNDTLSLETYRDVVRSLEKAIPSSKLRKYVLSNLKAVTREKNIPSVEWKCAVSNLLDDIESVEDFPLEGVQTFKKPVMFIGGANSSYITRDVEPSIKRFFPNSSIHIIKDADHFVYVDKPRKVAVRVHRYLNKIASRH